MSEVVAVVPALPFGTVTLLLGDVEGSTRLWVDDGPAAADAMRKLRAHVAHAVDRHHGALPLEQGEGDSFVAAFGRAADAVACAIDVQLALAREAAPISARMALHVGDVEIEADGRYVGETFNRCARVRELAPGGQTLLSRPVHDLVADHLPEGVMLEDLGAHHLRDLARPEHVYQLCHPALALERPNVGSRDERHNLPAELTTFIGREGELHDLAQLVAESRVVTLTGAGGCGKTRLALRLARSVIESFVDGVWWTDLGPLGDPELVASALASVLRVREVPNEPLPVTLARRLRDRRMLIVFDNCEHVIGASASLVDGLLRSCPDLVVLVTSREPLAVTGEVCFVVPSLSFPDDREASSIESIGRFDAVRLFFDRARRARPHLRLCDDDANSVARICNRLDGIPLAIELAAARLRVQSPHDIAEGLAQSFRTLVGGDRTALPRQRTLEASVDWSYRLLSEEERTLLARLSTFAGGFEIAAAEAVCTGGRIEHYAVLDIISRLVDKSLVLSEGRETTQFRLLETIRDYARRRLSDTGDAQETRDRHLAFHLAVAEDLERDYTGGGRGRSVKGRERHHHDDFRASLEWAIQTGDGESACRLVGALEPLWSAGGDLSEALDATSAALALPGTSAEARVRALVGQVDLEIHLGRLAEAGASASRSVELARDIDHKLLLGRALNGLGWVAMLAERREARPLLEGAVALHRSEDDPWWLVDSLFALGNLDLYLGRLQDACASAREGLAFAVADDDQLFMRLSYLLSIALQHLGDVAGSERVAVGYLDRARQSGDAFWTAFALIIGGENARLRGDGPTAELLLTEAIEAAADSANPFADGAARLFLARVEMAHGELDEAAAHLTEAAEMLVAVGLEWLATHALVALGDVADAQDDVAGARRRWQDARALAEASENPLSVALAQLRQARIANLDGSPRRAESLVHDALTSFVDAGDRRGVIDALDELARLALTYERWVDAARLLGAADAARELVGVVPSFEVTSVLETLRSQLSDVELSSAFDAGRALSIDDAVALVRKGRGARKRPPAGWESLTPTELHVAQLVADGLTNPQIAERLFVAPGTVKVHVSHVFAKLGISRRAELAAAATRQGSAE